MSEWIKIIGDSEDPNEGASIEMDMDRPYSVFKSHTLNVTNEEILASIQSKTGFIVTLDKWETFHDDGVGIGSVSSLAIVRDPSIPEEVYKEWETLAEDLEEHFDKETIAFHMPRVESWAKERTSIGSIHPLDYLYRQIKGSIYESEADSAASRDYEEAAYGRKD